MAKKGMKEVSGVYVPTTTTPMTMNIDYSWIKCSHKDECSDYPNSCAYCKHKNGDKKSYYEPANPPYIYPYYPYIPCDPWGTSVSLTYG